MTLQDFPHQLTIQVQWGEMDALGHVNNASYVRWGESARMGFFESADIFDRALYQPVLGYQSLKYIASVIYPDTVRIGTLVDEIKHDRFVLKSHFFSDKLERLVAIHYHEIVVLDKNNGKRLDVPDTVIAAIKAFGA